VELGGVGSRPACHGRNGPELLPSAPHHRPCCRQRSARESRLKPLIPVERSQSGLRCQAERRPTILAYVARGRHSLNRYECRNRRAACRRSASSWRFSSALRYRAAISSRARRLASIRTVGVARGHGARDVPGDVYDRRVASARFRGGAGSELLAPRSVGNIDPAKAVAEFSRAGS
jgi:hypothetical protein